MTIPPTTGSAGAATHRRPKSNRRRRTLLIPAIRVTPEEKQAIEDNAAAHAVTTADFLRKLGQGKTPRSKVDQQAILALIQIAGDLGRLGGLLKHWVSLQEQRPRLALVGAKGEQDGEQIGELLRSIKDTQELLKGKIELLR